MKSIITVVWWLLEVCVRNSCVWTCVVHLMNLLLHNGVRMVLCELLGAEQQTAVLVDNT